MILLGVCIGVVLGTLGTLLWMHHRRDHMDVVSLRRYDEVIHLYLRTLERNSASSIEHHRITTHPTSGQKRLLEEVNYAGELIGAVNGRFVVDTDNTVLDRNGNLELWMYTQNDVSEVFYIPATSVPIITGVFADVNRLFNKHLTTGVIK